MAIYGTWFAMGQNMQGTHYGLLNVLTFNHFYREWQEEANICLSVGKERVKEPVE